MMGEALLGFGTRDYLQNITVNGTKLTIEKWVQKPFHRHTRVWQSFWNIVRLAFFNHQYTLDSFHKNIGCSQLKLKLPAVGPSRWDPQGQCESQRRRLAQLERRMEVQLEEPILEVWMVDKFGHQQKCWRLFFDG